MMPKKKESTQSRAYVANYPPLAAWLKKHEARCFWQLPLGGEPDDPTSYVEHYMFQKDRNIGLAIVVVHRNGMGWEIYTPCTSHQIDDTLEDAEKRLGLEHKP